jgi:adenine-specific DNA methylase
MRRLIEEAFPLKKVSEDSKHEKTAGRLGHISTLHFWPARRPLAACRAAIIATLLPDPGDAELIVGLAARGEADGGQARIDPEHMGSIDARPVRALVEDVLEGGRAAFEKRRAKYGF